MLVLRREIVIVTVNGSVAVHVHMLRIDDLRVIVLMIEIAMTVFVCVRRSVGVRMRMKVLGHRDDRYGPTAIPNGAKPVGRASVVVGVLAAENVGVYTVTVLLPTFPTYSRPDWSNASASGSSIPVVIEYEGALVADNGNE